MKLPTIMNKGCSSAEIITDQRNGLLPSENVDDWANTILKAVKTDKLKELRQPAYKEVYKTWDAVTAEILKYYEQVIQQYSNSK